MIAGTKRTKYEGILGFVRATQKLRKRCTNAPQYSTDALLLKHGRLWPWTGELPQGVKPGRLGECFMNASKLATEDPGRFTYCEGLALFLIPVAHAWCVDNTGQVVDPTWDGNGLQKANREYFGIPFKVRFLREAMLSRGLYSGVIDWPPHYPVFSRPARDWKAKLLAAARPGQPARAAR